MLSFWCSGGLIHGGSLCLAALMVDDRSGLLVGVIGLLFGQGGKKSAT
jgi:hypothetical protein